MPKVVKLPSRSAIGALALWRYCEASAASAASAAFIFANQIMNPKSRKILDALEQQGAMSLVQIYKLFHNKVTKSEIEQALEEISTHIQARTREGQGGLIIRLAMDT